MTNCNCRHHQTKSKRKPDYRATAALIARAEWERMTPEEKAEIERQKQAHAEWLEKWDNMTLGEQLKHSIQTMNAGWKTLGESLNQVLRPKQPID